MKSPRKIKIGDLVKIINKSFGLYFYSGRDDEDEDPLGIVIREEKLPSSLPEDEWVYHVLLIDGAVWSFYGSEIEAVGDQKSP